MRTLLIEKKGLIRDPVSLRGSRIFPVLMMLLFLFLLPACKKDKEEEENSGNSTKSFDREAMLTNYGENLIIPSYETLKSEVSEMDQAVADFVSSPDNAGLQEVQSQVLEAYEAWQSCSVYELGPASDLALRNFTNTFPTDTAEIEDKIASGSWDLGQFDTKALKGFPALDYLLFDPDNGDSEVLNSYTSASNASSRKNYLSDVSDDLLSNVDQVLQEWKSSGGDHLKTFVEATGTDVGSSLGLMVNELNFDLELIKNAEIGIPLGKKSLGNPKPGNCQAYFSEHSVALSLHHLRALRDVFLGKSSEGNGSGLDDHLAHTDATYDGEPLHQAIEDQFQVAIDDLKKVPSPLSDAVVNSSSKVDDAYAEVQKLVVLLKSDMPSALGVQITYQDNDGD